MLHDIWTARSLRFWVGVGMALAVIPLGLSAVGGYMLLNHGIVAGFQDVAARQRYQIAPMQRLRLLIWDAVVPVDDFVDEGNPADPPAYRALRQRIEAGFAAVHDNLASEAEARTLVERARDEWTAADHLATEAISVRRPPGDPKAAELMDRFHGHAAAAVDKLGAVGDALAVDLRKDHDDALLAYERSEWLAGIAAAVSALLIVLGVYTIGRMMALSVDRLVVGAAHFAAGDRTHRIEVRVPPELRRVADEFNRMIVRIHETEEALADLARRDGLTGLLNRRAFDDALNEAFARVQRLGEPVALLMIDIDHFKRINDTYGHAVGDEMLRTVARTIAADLRVFDRVFRIGGEEFGALLLGADAATAGATGERLRQAIAAKRVLVQGSEIAATVSIGVATATEALDPETLVETADQALYRAKSAGRDRVVIAGDDDAAGQAEDADG